MNHQDALTCAAKLAGHLNPKRSISLQLNPKYESKPAEGIVSIDVFGINLDELNRIEKQISAIGYRSEYSDSCFTILGKY